MQNYDFILNTFYGPGALDPGRYQAFQKAVAGGVERVVGASLSVELAGI
jgi:hypothetical protein